MPRQSALHHRNPLDTGAIKSSSGRPQRTFGFAAAMAALAGCATAPTPVAPRSVYVMRHLQKAEGPDPSLNARGQRCAVAAADMLSARGIRAIYVSTTNRARETARPLATRLGIAPADYDPRDTPALAARVRAEAGTVLVVGHSNTVPGIVEALGGARPADLAEDNYGEVWQIGGDGTVTTTRIEGC